LLIGCSLQLLAVAVGLGCDWLSLHLLAVAVGLGCDLSFASRVTRPVGTASVWRFRGKVNFTNAPGGGGGKVQYFILSLQLLPSVLPRADFIFYS
jgi:hypothetical protein